MNSWISLSIAILLWLGVTQPAHAERTVAALGLRSLDGEAELERRLSTGLRTTAASLGGYTVSDRVVSLEQMTLAHGCDEPDESCLAQIAQTLAVELLTFGSVVASRGAHDMTLSVYDAPSAKLNRVTLQGLTAEQLAPAALGETLAEPLRRLLSPPLTGKLRIQANRPDAEVSIDAITRGMLDDDGVFELELHAGSHVVRVAERPTGTGQRPAVDQQTVQVVAGETTELRVTLAPPVALHDSHLPVVADPAPAPTRDPHRVRRALGWTSVGLGTAFAAATLYSWIRIGRINDDDDYNAYRAKFPRSDAEGGVSNVCTAAKRGTLAMREAASAGLERNARDLCDEADTLEVLQYVFLAGAVVGGGVGTYLLLTSRKRPERQLSLQPRFGTSRAVLEASFRF